MDNVKKTSSKIAEVAAHCGVSRTTVSYIMNDKWKSRGISERTADRVLKYVKDTGFLPNPASLILKGRAIKDIAIIVPTNAREHQKDAFFALLELLRKSGKKYMMLPRTESNLPETVQFIKMYNIPRVIVITMPAPCNFVEEWKRLCQNLTGVDYFFYDFPFGQANAEKLLFSPGSVAVGINRQCSNLKALKYLLSRGYERVILPEKFFENLLTDDFVKTYAPNVHFDFYKVTQSDSLFQMGWDIGKQLLRLIKKNQMIPAVYIHDDQMSAAVMKCLKTNGFSVPQDVALLSCDGLPESDYFIASLATCVMPHGKMLDTAMKWMNNKPLESQQIVFDVEIREGETLPQRNPLLIFDGFPAI